MTADFSVDGELPYIVTAWIGDDLVGTACLKAEPVYTHAHLGPWLGGLFVTPSARKIGVATALVAAVEAEARRRGLRAIYTGTDQARGLLVRSGWEHLAETEQMSVPLGVFVRPLGA